MPTLEQIVEQYDRKLREDIKIVIEARVKSINDRLDDFDRRLTALEKLIARLFQK